MTDKQLQKLKRSELLEIMLEQSKRIEELEAQLEAANAQINSRRIIAEESGSIAEAAMRLNGVFEAAQKAADQYLANIAYLYQMEKKKSEKNEA